MNRAKEERGRQERPGLRANLSTSLVGVKVIVLGNGEPQKMFEQGHGMGRSGFTVILQVARQGVDGQVDGLRDTEPVRGGSKSRENVRLGPGSGGR